MRPSHRVGRSVFLETLAPPGPRNCGQGRSSGVNGSGLGAAWVVVGAGLLLLVVLGLVLLRPPRWVVARLDSPDGRYGARVLRINYMQDHYVIQLNEGRRWRTLHVTAPITNSFRVDLDPTLSWSNGSSQLVFSIRGRAAWGIRLPGEELLYGTGADSPAAGPGGR